MLKVADLVAQLPEDEQLALTNALGAGLHDARMAVQCLTDPDRHSENVMQILTYVNRSIEQLEAARDLIRRRA